MFKFRPHHFLCTLGFEGKGYSPHFVNNYQAIVVTLTENPLTSILVVDKLDDICHACPHQRPKELCSKQQFIAKLDNAHQSILGIKAGQVITWQKAQQLIKSNMTLERFHQACEGCEWKSLGICEHALKRVVAG